MTSILTFTLDKGNQMVVVGDTQHTYSHSTQEESKIDLFNNLLFCGSGQDRIIWDINGKIKGFKTLTNCSNKILEIKKEKIKEYERIQNYGLSAEWVEDCDFLLVDTQNIKANKIIMREINSISQIDMIGSGSSKIGEIQQKLRNVYDFPFGDHLFDIIIKLFDSLGRHDPYTGHPAIFSLEMYLTEKNKSPIKFRLKFKPNIRKRENYEIIEEDA